jgi:hypothetical protein
MKRLIGMRMNWPNVASNVEILGQRGLVKLIAGAAITCLIFFSVPITSSATSFQTRVFANCTALNKVYPGGVAKSSKVSNVGGKTRFKPTVDAKVYEANRSKDRDKDGIACEK